jgi:2-polyprenyl-3-methyl-5-hydroxy-6-metoxy-1,4-benzoquinol methylase
MNIIWDIYAELYDLLVTKIEEEVDRKIIDLSNNLEGLVALDCGCGTGDLAHKLSQGGARVTAIDFSRNMLKKARRKYATDDNIIWHEGNFIDLMSEKPPESVELIVSKKSLYGVEVESFCRTASNILTPNGKIIIALPNEKHKGYLFPNGDFSFRHLLKYGLGKVGDKIGIVSYKIPTKKELMDSMVSYFCNVQSYQINHGTYNLTTGTKK